MPDRNLAVRKGSPRTSSLVAINLTQPPRPKPRAVSQILKAPLLYPAMHISAVPKMTNHLPTSMAIMMTWKAQRETSCDDLELRQAMT